MNDVAVRRDPWVWPAIAAICVATVLWAVGLQYGGQAGRYPAVPVSFATFLGVQLLMPRLRWNGARVLGPGNVAALLFALQLVVVPALIVVSGPHPGTLGIVPADRYVNAGLLLQAAAYLCFAIGYVGWTKPIRPRTVLSQPRLASMLAAVFIALGAVGLILTFPSPGALVNYFTGRGDVFEAEGPATLASAASTFLRPFLAYGLIILWAARISRRRPGGRMRPVEIGLLVGALAVSATYDYNRGAVVVPLLALVTAYGCFGRPQRPARLVALLALVAGIGFAFGEYRDYYSGTHGGAINPADAGLDRPGAAFDDYLQVYANGPQFWATVIQDVDRAGTRHGETIPGSALYPVPVLGKPFRADSGVVLYNELIYAQRGINDQNLGFGAELYWNFGIPGVVVGYLVFGFAIRRFDDRVEAAPDALVSYSWAYCGTWTAFLVIDSISVLTQIMTYFFLPVVATFVVAASGSRNAEVGA